MQQAILSISAEHVGSETINKIEKSLPRLSLHKPLWIGAFIAAVAILNAISLIASAALASEPEMIKIKGGCFLMGSPDTEERRDSIEKQHQVCVKDFIIGRHEVTFAEYDAFAEATGRVKPYDFGWGRGKRPVINVSWFDAVAYAGWLSQKTGKSYRLPTEAEWEYAARAGTTTPFSFGHTISADQANYNGNYTYGNGSKGVYRGQTVEVGQFPANDWGLYDMHGNVWEWTCSEFDADYKGAEMECADENSDALRVLRGGSWHYGPRRVRSATRNSLPAVSQLTVYGFRLARSK